MGCVGEQVMARRTASRSTGTTPCHGNGIDGFALVRRIVARHLPALTAREQ